MDPIPASTDQASVVVTVHYGIPGKVTVEAESGTFTGQVTPSGPAQVEVTLLPDTTHHLKVTIDAPRVGPPNCGAGGYSLSTDIDNHGAPLVIARGAAP